MGRNFHRKRRVPFDVILLALAAVAAGIIAVTAALTAAEYGNLPDRVPLHFGIDGKPSWYGPRPTIWLMVAIQIVVCVSLAPAIFAVRGAPGGAPSELGAGVFGICILAAVAHAQFAIVAAAKSPDQRLAVGRFLATTGALVALAFLSMRFL